MNKKMMYYVFLIFYLARFEKIMTRNRPHQLGFDTIDPMSDFRMPQSLTELLHEGLVNLDGVMTDMDDQNSESIGLAMDRVSVILSSMHRVYDEMIDTSRMHEIYRDDRQFLQNLIDRIDQMIESLERRSQLSVDDTDALRRNIVTLRDLRSKME